MTEIYVLRKKLADSIPIYLLTGTLGSGKTTLLNHLLRFEQFKTRHTCLIVNEFGAMGVDGERVNAGDSPMFELNNGSIFCICIKTDFIAALQEIANNVKPDCLLVEATGMAEPRDVQDFIDVPDLRDAFHIQATLCLVDAGDFIRIVPMLRAARQQVLWADALLINKCDRVGEKELHQLDAVLQDMNPDAPRIRLEYANLPESFLDSVRHRVRHGDPVTEPPDPVFAVSFKSDGVVSRPDFEAAVKGLGDHLLRLKGQVDFGKGSEFVEYAGGEFMVSPDKSIRRIAKTPTAFIAIGWRIRQSEFSAAFGPLL